MSVVRRERVIADKAGWLSASQSSALAGRSHRAEGMPDGVELHGFWVQNPNKRQNPHSTLIRPCAFCSARCWVIFFNDSCS